MFGRKLAAYFVLKMFNADLRDRPKKPPTSLQPGYTCPDDTDSLKRLEDDLDAADDELLSRMRQDAKDVTESTDEP